MVAAEGRSPKVAQTFVTESGGRVKTRILIDIVFTDQKVDKQAGRDRL